MFDLNVVGYTFLAIFSILGVVGSIAYLYSWKRRWVLSLTGLLEKNPGSHRCLFCSLFDQQRGVCLVIVSHPRWEGEFRHRRTKWYNACHWHKDGHEPIAQVFDVEKSKESLEDLEDQVEKPIGIGKYREDKP